MSSIPEVLRRVAAAAVLLLHVGVAGGLPYVDAKLDLAGFGHRVHVDGERTGPCAPQHDDFTCQICRTLGSHLMDAAPTCELPPMATGSRSATPAATTPPVLTPHSAPLGPRAPPIA